MKYKLNTTYKKLLADTFTPVSVYLKLRDKFPNSILLESSDYHGNENSFSYICCKSIASIIIDNEIVTTTYPDGNVITKTIDSTMSIPNEIKAFADSFESKSNEFKFINNGLFGYINYDAVRYFEDIIIDAVKKEAKKIPDIIYNIYQYVIAIDHFKDEVYIFEHSIDQVTTNGVERIEELINNKNFSSYRSEEHTSELQSPM